MYVMRRQIWHTRMHLHLSSSIVVASAHVQAPGTHVHANCKRDLLQIAFHSLTVVVYADAARRAGSIARSCAGLQRRHGFDSRGSRYRPFVAFAPPADVDGISVATHTNSLLPCQRSAYLLGFDGQLKLPHLGQCVVSFAFGKGKGKGKRLRRGWRFTLLPVG